MVNAGQKLSHTAGQLGYSQTVLAREIGVSQAAISKIFHGDQVLSFDNAFKLARKLGISLDWLADNETPLPSRAEIDGTNHVQAAVQMLGNHESLRPLLMAADTIHNSTAGLTHHLHCPV